jgi:hypothetical protein
LLFGSFARRRDLMSADWYFMKKSFFGGSKTVGPIAESDFVKKIQKGEIAPETMVSSTSKTHGHWLHLREIRTADQYWRKSQSSSNSTKGKDAS